MTNERAGILIQQLADDEKALYDLIVKGNKMGSALKAIAQWLDSLNESKTNSLRFERGHEIWIDGTGKVEIPEDLKGHIDDVVLLQNRIAETKNKLRDELGIDAYAAYDVSVT